MKKRNKSISFFENQAMFGVNMAEMENKYGRMDQFEGALES